MEDKQKVKMFVTHVEAQKKFLIIYGQMDEDGTTKLEELMAENDYYLENSYPPSSILELEISQTVCAKYIEDQKWYRAKVNNVDIAADTVEVLFIDYGNSETVERNSVRKIDGELEYMQPQATMCVMGTVFPADMACWVPEAVHFLDEMVCYQEVTVVQLNVQATDDGSVVHIVSVFLENGTSVAEKLVEAGFAKKAVQCPERSLKKLTFSPGEEHSVYIAHVDSVSEFYVQLQSYQEHLENLMAVMDHYYKSACTTVMATHAHLGSLHAAKYGPEEDFYRAEVTRMLPEGHAEIWYVDYGNREVVSLAELKDLRDNFLELPAQAIKCTLHVVSAAQSTSPSSKSDLEKYIDNPLRMKIVSVGNSLSVHLFKGTASLAEEIFGAHSVQKQNNQLHRMLPQSQPMTAEQLPAKYKSIKLQKGQIYEVILVHFEKPSTLFCNVIKDSNALDDLMTKIEHAYLGKNVPNLGVPVPGAPCCAQYTEDDGWYRAELRSVSGLQGQVYYVDYGNSEVLPLSRVRVLIPEFMQLSKQAVKCELSGASPGALDENLVLKLIESACSLQMKVVSENNDTFIVMLQDKNTGKNVNQELGAAGGNEKQKRVIPLPVLDEMESLFITNVESPAHFFGQLVKLSLEELDNFQMKLNEHYEKSNAPGLFDDKRKHNDEFCAVKYSLDNSWYRGCILSSDYSQAVVRFVDYGNIEPRPFSMVKQLANKFLNFPQHAVECELSSTLPALPSEEFKVLLMDATIKVKVLMQDENGKCTVELTDKDITTSLLGNSSTQQQQKSKYRIQDQTPTTFRSLQIAENTTEETVVVHIESPEEVYCQILKSSDELQALMQKLQTYCQKTAGITIKGKPKLEMVCAAKFSGDGLWYRCKVVGVLKSGEVEVRFVDYGNTERVSVGDICSLSPELLDLPIQCVCCRLQGLTLSETVWPTEYTNILMQMVLDKVVKTHFVHQSLSGEFICEITDMKGNSINKAFQEKLQPASATGFESRRKLSDRGTSDFNTTSFSSRGNNEESFRSFIPKPRREDRSFGESENWDKSNQFKEAVREDVNWSKQKRDTGSGGVEDNWGAPRKNVESFGGEDPWEKPRRGGYSDHDDRRNVVTQERNKFSGNGSGAESLDWRNQDVNCDDWDQAAPSNDLKYTCQEVNIGSVDVGVEFVISPSEFYCQLVSESMKLKQLMNKLAHVYDNLSFKQLELAGPKVGQVCAAQYSEDNVWYRAEVVKVLPTVAEVQFVDYGNMERVGLETLKSLRPEFVSLPKQGLKCSLNNLKPIELDWQDEDITVFENFVFECKLVGNVINKSSDGSLMLDLTDGAKDIGNEMVKSGIAQYIDDQVSKPSNLPRTHSGSPPQVKLGSYIEPSISCRQKDQVALSWIISPEEFYCQVLSTTDKLTELMSAIESYYTSIGDSTAESLKKLHPDIPCVAKYSEDGAWYRAQVWSINTMKILATFTKLMSTCTFCIFLLPIVCCIRTVISLISVMVNELVYYIIAGY